MVLFPVHTQVTSSLILEPLDTRVILSTTMLEYMEAVGDANELFADGELPSLKAYWARRDYAAGIYPGIATIPYVLLSLCTSFITNA
jgi:hypothetical protein